MFRDAPVIARFGAPGSLAEQPWFSRDALRTAASWAGMADTAAAAALDELAQRPERGQLEALAAGRILTAQRTIDLWIERGARAMDAPGDALATIALQARVGISDACRVLLDEAARACGSRPFARAARSIARGGTSRYSCSSTGSTRCSHAWAKRRSRSAEMARMSPAEFEARYRANPDPWGYTTSDYERRKYEATLTACGDGPFADALELGGSIGVFSALLAPRCERLTTIDAAATAVASARRRLAGAPHVDVILGEIPDAIPIRDFDLVVASEILYYLTASELARTVAAAGVDEA